MTRYVAWISHLPRLWRLSLRFNSRQTSALLPHHGALAAFFQFWRKNSHILIFMNFSATFSYSLKTYNHTLLPLWRISFQWSSSQACVLYYIFLFLPFYFNLSHCWNILGYAFLSLFLAIMRRPILRFLDSNLSLCHPIVLRFFNPLTKYILFPMLCLFIKG